jgi:1-deoxy-D-xylulose 5-phosphate reductoisomerase
VAAFLAGEIRFTAIASICADVLDRVSARPFTRLDDALAADEEARSVARACAGLPGVARA